MIGKKIKAKTNPNSRYPEVLTVLDKVRGIYYNTEIGPEGVHTRTSTTITLDYYLCKQENGTIIQVLPSSIESLLEEDKRPEVTY